MNFRVRNRRAIEQTPSIMHHSFVLHKIVYHSYVVLRKVWRRGDFTSSSVAEVN